jgi:hypothetical protein
MCGGAETSMSWISRRMSGPTYDLGLEVEGYVQIWNLQHHQLNSAVSPQQ